MRAKGELSQSGLNRSSGGGVGRMDSWVGSAGLGPDSAAAPAGVDASAGGFAGAGGWSLAAAESGDSGSPVGRGVGTGCGAEGSSVGEGVWASRRLAMMWTPSGGVALVAAPDGAGMIRRDGRTRSGASCAVAAQDAAMARIVALSQGPVIRLTIPSVSECKPAPPAMVTGFSPQKAARKNSSPTVAAAKRKSRGARESRIQLGRGGAHPVLMRPLRGRSSTACCPNHRGGLLGVHRLPSTVFGCRRSALARDR